MGEQAETTEASEDKSEEMFGPRDLVGFLFGSRRAIEKLIHCRRPLVFGAVLVATAAFSREYDAVSLWHSPQDLLAPFAASIILATFLFVWLAMLPRQKMVAPEKFTTGDYVIFLAGYWLTAPLAWLYAIPVETLFSEYTAVVANLTLLSIVSVWRVLLFSRFVSVRYGRPMIISLAWILIPCTIVAIGGLIQQQISLVGIMGGIRQTAAEQAVTRFSDAVVGISVWTLGISVAVSLAYLAYRFGAEYRALPELQAMERRVIIHWRLWALAGVVFACLFGGIAYFQPKMYRAAEVERLIKNDELSEAIQYMVQSESRAAFPESWDPPPRRRGRVSNIDEMIRTVHKAAPPIWVSDILLDGADELLIMKHRHWLVGFDEERAREFANQLNIQERRELLDSLSLLEEIPFERSHREFEDIDLVGIMGDFVVESEEEPTNSGPQSSEVESLLESTAADND